MPSNMVSEMLGTAMTEPKISAAREAAKQIVPRFVPWAPGTAAYADSVRDTEVIVQRAIDAEVKPLVEALTEALCWFGPGSAVANGAKCETREEMLAEARSALAKRGRA